MIVVITENCLWKDYKTKWQDYIKISP